jgi:hypothetical protein
MTQSQGCYPSVQACALRIVRRDATGAEVSGTTGGYVTNAMTRLTVTPEQEAGLEFLERNACGEFVVNNRDRDLIKRYAVELDLLHPDPEIEELLIGSSLITSGSQSVGAQVPLLGTTPSDNGVSVEWWSYAKVPGAQNAPSLPYFHWVLPWSFWQIGANEFGNSPLVTHFTGYAVENANFGTGPMAPLFSAAITRAYARQRDSAAPPATACGYTTIT